MKLQIRRHALLGGEIGIGEHAVIRLDLRFFQRAALLRGKRAGAWLEQSRTS